MPYKQVSIITKKWKNQKPPVGSQIDWSHPLSQGLVGCWLMNEGGGKIAKDLIKNNYGSLGTGQSFKKGAINFDGTNANYINLNKNYSPTTLPATLVYKFRVANLTAHRVVFNSCLNTVTPAHSGIFSAILSTGTIDIQWGDNVNSAATGRKTFRSNVGIITTGTDYLFCGTISNAVGKLYLNGVSIGVNVTGTAITYNGGTLNGSIGQDKDGFEFYGTIDFIYLYSRILSPSEIQQLYVEPYCFIQPTRRRFYFQTGEAPAANKPTRRRVILSCN